MWKGNHDKLFCSQSTVYHLSSQRSGPCDETCCQWESVGGVSFRHIICQHTHSYTHKSTHPWSLEAGLAHTQTRTNACKPYTHWHYYPLALDAKTSAGKQCVRACVCGWHGRQLARHMAHGKCVSKSQKHLSPSVCVCVCVCGFQCWRMASSLQHLSLGVDGPSRCFY